MSYCIVLGVRQAPWADVSGETARDLHAAQYNTELYAPFKLWIFPGIPWDEVEYYFYPEDDVNYPGPEDCLILFGIPGHYNDLELYHPTLAKLKEAWVKWQDDLTHEDHKRIRSTREKEGW
jgi:hypothetical protein